MITLIPGKNLNRNAAKPVSDYSEIERVAEQMLVRVAAPFHGAKYTAAFALAHSQVAMDHWAFFVLHPDLVEKEKLFPSSFIVNPQVLETPAVIKMTVQKLGKEPVKAIKNMGPLPEACLSFPHRTEKGVMRFHKIKVSYQYPVPNGRGGWKFKSVTTWLDGLAAHIFQHETDHLRGINIYHA